MIKFIPICPYFRTTHKLVFDDGALEKMVFWLSRAANTHHDPELTKLLDELREVK